jgi:predicted RNase H-like HicB family nuclease
MVAGCTIVVERRKDGSYYASCSVFPDCEAVAATEEEARRAVEVAIERRLEERANKAPGQAETSL